MLNIRFLVASTINPTSRSNFYEFKKFAAVLVDLLLSAHKKVSRVPNNTTKTVIVSNTQTTVIMGLLLLSLTL